MSGNNSGTSGAGGGVSFLVLLTVLFVGLKLTGHIDWPWWQVAIPYLLRGVWVVVASILLAAVKRK